MKKFPIILITIVYCAGIILSRFLNVPIASLWLSLAVVITLGLIAFEKAKFLVFDIFIVLGFFILGMFSFRVNLLKEPSHINNFSYLKEFTVEGYVVSFPQKLKSVYKFILRPKKLDSLSFAGKGISGDIKTVLCASQDIFYGDFLRMEAQFKSRRSANYLYARKSQILRRCVLNPFKFLAFKFRKWAQDKFGRYFPLQDVKFLRAFILGERSALRFKDYLPFKMTGTMHLLAISGLHTGIVVAIFSFLLKFLGIKRKARFIMLLLVLVFWVFFTGFRPPVIRASFLVGFWVLSFFLQRKTVLMNNLFLSGFIILLFNPQDLFNIGFQLSYVCVLFIAWGFPLYGRIIPRIRNPLLKYALDIFFISLFAFLGTFPLVSHYFGVISVLGILSNILLVPLLFLIILSSFLFLFLWGPLSQILAGSAHIFLRLLISINNFFAGFAFSHLNLRFSLLAVFIYYLTLGSVYLIFQVIKRYFERYRELEL